MTEKELRAASDPVVFQSEKVLRALKEPYEDGPKDYFKQFQLEITPRMRQVVAEWMLEVCEEEQSQPELFCLAVNCLDRYGTHFLQGILLMTHTLQVFI
jgi:cyclin A